MQGSPRVQDRGYDRPMARRSKEARVAFARVDFAEDSLAPRDYAAALEDSLTPGKTVVRYERLWRMTRHTTDDGWIFGRIGFENPATGEIGVWDEATKDYRSIQPGQIVRYAIDVGARRVGFELKSGVVRPGTFQGNFQALLNRESPYRWRVHLEGVAQPPWEEWRAWISRLTKVSLKMERPNPRYPGELVEHMFEDAKLAAATIGASGDDIDIDDSELLRQAFALAQTHGHIRAEGVVGPEAKKEEWRSEEEGAVERDTAKRDPDTQEIPPDEFKRVLQKRREQDSG
jgi:hypothetical protein